MYRFTHILYFMKKSILLLLVFVPCFAFAQNQKELDSLNNLINSNISEDKKFSAYDKLLGNYLYKDTIKYNNLIKNLIKKNASGTCQKCEYIAYYYKGHYYNIKMDIKNSVLNFEKSAQKSMENNDFKYYQNAKSWIVQVYLNDGKLNDAEKILNQSFLEAKNKQDKDVDYDKMYFTQGILNYRKGHLKAAIDSYISAEKYLLKNYPDSKKFRSSILNNIAQVYKELKNYKKAKEYVNQASNLASKTSDSLNLMVITLHKGVIETDSKNFKSAIPFLHKSYYYFKKNFHPEYFASSAFYLGIVNYEQSKYEISKKYLMEAKKLYEGNDNSGLAQILSYLALIDASYGKNEDAIKGINESKKLLKNDKESPVYLELLDAEEKIYDKLGRMDLAFKSLKAKDSFELILRSKTNLQSLNEVEAKYQTEKKEQQIKLLSTQNELAQKQKYVYLSLLGLLAIIGGSLFYGYRNKIKTAQKLNELNELKSRFFANISHEFRTPLTLIKSPVQSLQSEINDENQKNKLNLIESNSSRMLELVDQLLELSKIDSGNLKLILKDGNISSFLNSILEPFEFQAKEKSINFTSNIQKTTENNAFDKDVIEKIVTNLVSNAFKYTPQNQEIVFAASVTGSNLKLLISNTGSDVKKEDLPKLFERFYQKKEAQQGFGIGLALVKELVALYLGSIETKLEDNELAFIVNLPLSVGNENAVVIPTKVESEMVENEKLSKNELPILLVVDDNPEIRMVLKDIFKKEYQILEAQDGEQALKITQKEIPDCIISDVMMPKMDGFEFTKAIKNNEVTSFIPVILLTAKTSDEAHLESLQSTADAFLTKPFNNEIVKATVQQLITERKKLHKRYSQELVLRPVDIVINSVEEQFLEKLQRVLDQELSNSNFSSEDFASMVGMSRMQLHRKLKSLLGVSATEFLRNERLKTATELLKIGNGNISDVAYAVGFNDVSYFSKCFKEMHGCTPTEFIEKQSF